MATGQDLSGRCRAIQLLSLLVLFGCSLCYVFTTVLLRLAVPCDAAEEAGVPQPAPPYAASEPEDNSPTPAPPFMAQEEVEPDSASIPVHPNPVAGKEGTGGGETEVASAPIDLPDEPMRCELPSRSLRQYRTLRLFSGIDSMEYCQKLCVLESECFSVEWDLHVGACYLKSRLPAIHAISALSVDSTSSTLQANQDHAASVCPSPVPGSQGQESCGARLKKQDHADFTAVAASGQEGSAASALVERRSSSSPYSPVPPDGRDGDRLFSFPSTASPSIAQYANASVSRIAATSLSQSSASMFHFPSPSANGPAAKDAPAGHTAADAETAALSYSTHSLPATTGEDLVRPYIMEDVTSYHGFKMVAPRTCDVSCWISNYVCSEKLPQSDGAVKKKTNTGPKASKSSSTHKLNRKSAAALTGAFSPAKDVYTAFDCRSMCEMEEACGAFSWNRFLNRCYFCPVSTYLPLSWVHKKVFFTAVRSHLTVDRAFITGPKLSCFVSGPEQWVTPVFQSCFHANKSTQSSSVTVIETLVPVPTSNDCQSECFVRAGCLHFTWQYHTQTCILKGGPIHNSLVPELSSISGPKSCFKGCLQIGVSYPKEAIIATVKTASVFDCQVACAAHSSPRCEGITYHFATYACDLAATPPAAASASSFLSSSSSSSSLLSLSSSPVGSSAGVDNFQHEAATTQQIPAISTPSFITKEAAKPAGALQPDAVCTMCVSAGASLCRMALPAVNRAKRPYTISRKSLGRKFARQAKETHKLAKRTESTREKVVDPRNAARQRRGSNTET